MVCALLFQYDRRLMALFVQFLNLTHLSAIYEWRDGLGTISKALEKSQHSFNFGHEPIESKHKPDDSTQCNRDHTKTDLDEHRSSELEQFRPINNLLFPEEYQKRLS